MVITLVMVISALGSIVLVIITRTIVARGDTYLDLPPHSQARRPKC
jgi:hypothetical protein